MTACRVSEEEDARDTIKGGADVICLCLMTKKECGSVMGVVAEGGGEAKEVATYERLAAG